MAEAFRAQAEQPDISQLSFEERFALRVDQPWNWKQTRARRLANAKLRHRVTSTSAPRAAWTDRCFVLGPRARDGWVNIRAFS